MTDTNALPVEAEHLRLESLYEAVTPDSDDPIAARLACWTALEALSPQTYGKPEELVAGDERCVANLVHGLPWTKGEPARKGYQLYYEVILGSIDLDRATEKMIAAFGRDEGKERARQKKASIATVLVDKNGRLFGEDSVAISSFAWALPLVLAQRLDVLHAWTRVEDKVTEALEQILRRQSADGELVPLDASSIVQAFDWLVSLFDLPVEMTLRPGIVLRRFHRNDSCNTPGSSLLNSFFIDDVSEVFRLHRASRLGRGVLKYLGDKPPEKTTDLLHDQTALETAVSPAHTPLARWPVGADRSLVLLQQAAVNIIAQQIDTDAVVAINGPPGTGKTTLLRDVIAHVVVERAHRLCAVEDPNKAFRATGQKLSISDKAVWKIYQLDPALRGHELLVASANNRAVENISRELPGLSEVADDSIRYFRTVSNALAEADRRDQANTGEDRSTWGLIAAVLGNMKNCTRFWQAFWWDEEAAFRLYLKAARGDNLVQEIKDGDGRIIERRTPDIVAMENPPASRAEAKKRYQKARRDFTALRDKVATNIASVEEYRQNCLRLARERRTEALLYEEVIRCGDALAELMPHDHPFNRQWFAWDHDARSVSALVQDKFARPHWVHRWFFLKRGRLWRALTQHHQRVVAQQQKMAARQRRMDAMRTYCGSDQIDEAFFQRPDAERQTATPWFSGELQQQRETLFVAAMNLHKAFIDVAAGKIMHNLWVLMNAMSSGGLADPAKKRCLGELWSTLFLVVPVISTTFASVRRMLGDLPPESIGWLLIDEAGQATPAHALGAAMRAQRTIVVGDPVQIPPIETLPERLIAEICAHYSVNRDAWAAPVASAQTLADRASPYQSSFETDTGERPVGIPLLVHRRCEEPMFTISNELAYNNLMVHQVPHTDGGEVRGALGPTGWLSVDGRAGSHWCAAEGERVIEMLQTLNAQGVHSPDLFIVTPFRNVRSEMKRLLRRQERLLRALGLDPKSFIEKRVGTVHTVQGHGADTVILLLGAPNASQAGARRWAGTPENLVNVAVSRAKRNLYVVGSHGAWRGAGSFSTLSKHLPVS